MINEDIALAQKIILGSTNNLDKNNTFHNSSFIYKFTNESVSSFQHHLKNKSNVLSITSSGDQILNCILEDSMNITSYDISVFPQYFFELKKAAILTLTKKEYIKFFLDESIYNEILDYKLYEILKQNLSKNARIFWDNLFNFFDGGEIYLSSLFSREPTPIKTIIENNKYLQDENYKILQTKLEKANIKHIVGDIKEINLKDSFDLILLSSIIYYGFNNIQNYKDLLNKLNLNRNGIIITYLYELKNSLLESFNENNFSFENFKNSNNGIMIYKK